MKETCEKQLMTTTKGMGLERETRVAWRGRILRLPTTIYYTRPHMQAHCLPHSLSLPPSPQRALARARPFSRPTEHICS